MKYRFNLTDLLHWLWMHNYLCVFLEENGKMLHNGPLQQNFSLHIILVVDLSSKVALEKPDCLFWQLSFLWGLLCGSAQSSMCVSWCSKWKFWQKPSCGWPFSSRTQPSRKNLLFLSPSYLCQVRLGPSLLAFCLLFTLQPDYSPSVPYQVLLFLCIETLKLSLLSWSLF